MSRYFPLFVNLEGKQVFVYGAGKIGTRRILALLQFGCKLTVIAPKATKEVTGLSKAGSLTWRQEAYRPGQIPADACLVLAATNAQEVNAQIGAECREKKLLVNVSSDKKLCDFYFPGLAVKEDLVAGVTAGGEDHKKARRAAEELRALVETL